MKLTQGEGGGMLRQFFSHLDLGMQETRVWSLGREDPLEKEVATHSSILAWEVPWSEEPVRVGEELNMTGQLNNINKLPILFSQIFETSSVVDCFYR